MSEPWAAEREEVEDLVCCQAHRIIAKTEEMRAWLVARGLVDE